MSKREKGEGQKRFTLRGQLGEETPKTGCCTNRSSLLLTETLTLDAHTYTQTHTYK